MNDRIRSFSERARQIGPTLAARAAGTDRDGRFVEDNYALLKEHGFFAALVPEALGGGGATYGQGVDLLRELGKHCGSTALALSMHSHLVAASVWKVRHGKPGDALLRRVADEQIVLVSTGAGDWLQSNGRAERVDGGYRLTGDKHFGSGSPAGDLALTSIAYDCPVDGPSVLHFALPLAAEGVEVRANWDAMGMRGTGSNSLRLDGVFVPAEAIGLKRPRDGWHPVWNVVLAVAPGLYMAPYVGIAEAAAEQARARVAEQPSEVAFLQLGALENQLMVAHLALQSLVDQVDDYDVTPDVHTSSRALAAKTLISEATIAVVEQAMTICGGASYLRGFGLERLLRDVRAAPFHPLPQARQQVVAGRVAVGLAPV
ncbi:MAG: acyl-CoA dehydrogenase family protein [Myxococcales bacterium]|nr:acyl-CoA dehydrogenase family protein [Myxococcales bacterium]